MMTPAGIRRSARPARWNRRRLIATGAAAAFGAASRQRGSAQELSGTIRVGYERGNPAIEEMVDAAMGAVEAAHPDARVERQIGLPGNYATQLLLAIAAGRAPDVFLLSGLGIGELADAGYIEPLDSWLGEWDGWSEYPEQVRSAMSYLGGYWAVPFAVDTHFLYYRRDLFERAGLPREWQPASTEEVLEAARILKASDDGIIPYGLYAGANGGTGTAVRGFLPLLNAHGGTLTDGDGRWIIESCPIRDALAYYEMVFRIDQTVPTDAMTSSNPAGFLRDALRDGELGILFEGSWVYGEWLAHDEQATRSEIGHALHPMADGSTPFTVGSIGNTWYIDARSERKALAWEFVKAVNSRESQIAVNLRDPHIPARADAAADPAFQADPFLATMIGTLPALVTAAPDPSFRRLLGVIQNATGIVATGDATPDEAMTRYGDEMARILGDEQVVRWPCG